MGSVSNTGDRTRVRFESIVLAEDNEPAFSVTAENGDPFDIDYFGNDIRDRSSDTLRVVRLERDLSDGSRSLLLGGMCP